jgi:hypothetical protein
MMSTTIAVKPTKPATRPYTTMRETFSTGTVVFSRTAVTTDSMRSAISAVQSCPAGDGGGTEDAMKRDYSRSPMRHVLAVIAGAAVAAFGGWILGEYPFTGLTPYIEGVLFALVVAEVIISIGRRPGLFTAAAAAVCTVGGLGLAVWISTGQGLDPIPVGAWVALGLGLVVALLRGGLTTAARRGQRSHRPG